MQNDDSSHVVSIRLPKTTYAKIACKSIDWNMSVSSIIRETVVAMFEEAHDTVKIKDYKRRAEKVIKENVWKTFGL